MKIHIVFDLDGTLIDTQKVHQKIESDFLKSKGIAIDPQDIGVKYAGRTPQERISELLISHGVSFTKKEIEDLVLKKNDKVFSLVREGKIDLIPYALEILTYLHDKNYKLGISSGSSRELLDDLIVYFGLDKIIIASTSADEVEHKKPNPDVFLSSFSKIEEIYGAPEMKYVVGDGWSDMEGGHKAGAKTIWLNFLKKKKENDVYCDIEIQSLQDIKNLL